MSAALVSLSMACGASASPSPPPPSTAVPSAPIVEPTSATPPPVVDPCAISRARVTSLLDSVRANVDGHGAASARARAALDEVSTSLTECTPTGRGAWTFSVADPSLTWEDESFDLHVSARVAFVDDTGVLRVGAREYRVGDQPAWAGHSRVTLSRFFDFDGDGTSEVFVDFDGHYYEESSRSTVLLAVGETAVAPYHGADGIDVSAVVDFDHDGRADIVSILRYWSATECGADPPAEGAPPVLFHSLVDGTFSSSDEVAAAFLRHECPSPPTRLLGDERVCGDVDARRAVACARAWGESAAHVRARIDDERAALSDATRDQIGWDDVTRVADIDPPLVLR